MRRRISPLRPDRGVAHCTFQFTTLKAWPFPPSFAPCVQFVKAQAPTAARHDCSLPQSVDCPKPSVVSRRRSDNFKLPYTHGSALVTLAPNCCILDKDCVICHCTSITYNTHCLHRQYFALHMGQKMTVLAACSVRTGKVPATHERQASYTNEMDCSGGTVAVGFTRSWVIPLQIATVK